MSVCRLLSWVDEHLRVRGQEAMEQEVLHQQADVHATIAAILLLWRVLEVHEAERRAAEQLAHLIRDEARFLEVAGGQAVVVEGDAVEDRDEQQRPVGPALRELDVAVVVDGQEDMRGVGEVRQRGDERARVGRVLQHEGHGRAKQADIGLGVSREMFVFEPPWGSRQSGGVRRCT